MKMHVLWVLVGVVSVVLAQQTPPQLWPKPSNIVSMSSSDEFYLTASQFRFTAVLPDGASSATDILYNAFDRYYQIIFANPSSGETSGLTQITGLQVTVVDSTSFIQFGVNETYSLNVTAPTSTIVAQTIFGAMHGLETFSQLLRNGITPQAYIVDTPRFPWRGLLLDTSRHYQELSTIRELIRGLSYDKMNTFHWHMSDGQSFPYQSQVYPNLTKGAYCPECVYSIEEIKAVINYANSYGVRVVVEFDMPSHAGPSWGKGYPFLTMNCSTAQCETFDLQYSDPCNDFPFDATNDAVYEFLQNFLEEVATVFPDTYLHMGGDEVQEFCWATEPVLEWMKDHNMTSFSELEQYFLSSVQSYATAQNKLIVNWEEVFTSGFTIPPGTIIEVWKDKTTLDSVAEAGYGALLAYGWYLDHLDTTWQDFYSNDPSDGTLNSQQEAFLYGGECCMWSEYVDATNVQPKVWPRTSAAAERLWSPQNVNNVADAQKRLTYQRCRFINRGLNATPIYPGPPCSTFNL